MTQTQDLLELESHFSFGENWSHYAEKIDEARIEEAEKSLLRLVGREAIEGKTFLDIGCGSGLFSLAAVRLGACKLLAVDLDPKSVETTRKTLSRYAAGKNWDVQNISVFHLDPEKLGVFDVVYSWGVLHHTGAMYQAITKAATMVGATGTISLALYAKTPFCGMWRIEKRIYSRSPRWVQKMIEVVYLTLVRLRLALKGESYQKRREKYWEQRGMDMYYDTRDWLGGYPYESISPEEAKTFMRGLGFDQIRAFTEPCIGLLGTGCDEYSFTRTAVRR
ncbi:MAG: methyltransferase domain-containing protein [Acidobacteria bacterium]|nr:methyltransferase domain-containing protein [Acidobacteriota bacterium]